MKIIECPRDAMQGIQKFIPTNKKIDYINQLLKIGFDTIDFGSFVSPKAIPQLKDTAKVIDGLDLSNTKSKLLAIIGNIKGAEIASNFDKICYIGYPHSISETFLQANINSNVEKSRKTIDVLMNICANSKKELVVYLSMAFGNPYSDAWNIDLIIKEFELLKKQGVKIISLSDTIGVASNSDLKEVVSNTVNEFKEIEIGLHLHTTPVSWKDKIEIAYKNGCRRFDSVINGLGGCPMAMHDLVGNLDTTNLVSFLEENNIKHNLNMDNYFKVSKLANDIFN